MDFRGRHIYLLDNLSAVPKRRLRTILKAVGACVAGHVTWHQGRLKIPIDAVVYGTDTLEANAPHWPSAPSIRDHWYELEVVEALGLELGQQERFERLRGLLHDEIDDDDWYQVCCLLEVWPNDASLAIALDYVKAHTARTKPHRLTALPRWILRLAAGQDEPRLAIVRNAIIPSRGLRGGRTFEHVVTHLLEQGVKHLDVTAIPNLGPRQMEFLANYSGCRSLEALKVRVWRWNQSPELRALQQAVVLKRCKVEYV